METITLPAAPEATTQPSPTPEPAPHELMQEKDIRLWSTLCHLTALVGLLIPSLGAVLGPLVVWLVKRNEHPTIDEHGKESLNFQLSVLVYCWALGLAGIATVWILIGFAFLALGAAIGIAALVLSVVGAIKASNGQPFHYPFSIRFLH